MTIVYNTCKYWQEKDPRVCVYWASVSTICTWEGENDIEGPGQVVQKERASNYPYCNLIGTSLTCNKFTWPEDSDEDIYLPKCILPNPKTHIGRKWVSVVETSDPEQQTTPLYNHGPEGNLSQVEGKYWSFYDISEYNDGQCDSNGTSVTCSGYSPRNISYDNIDTSAATESCFVDGEGLVYILPIVYEVLNIRAKFSTCLWWDGSPVLFELDDVGEILSFDSKCTNENSVVDPYKTGKDSNNLVQHKCNGCNDMCPKYTGICWRYCINEYLKPGDKILAEQIQELRYYLRMETWDEKNFKSLFYDDGNIYSWEGDIDTTIDDRGSKVYKIPATRVYIENFDPFTIGYDHMVLTAGIPVVNGPPNYPSLIRELNHLPIVPIIRNRFNINAYGDNYIETTNIMGDVPKTLPNGDIWNESFFIYGSIPDITDVYLININDPDLKYVIPREIFERDSMLDVKLVLGNNYDAFYSRLSSILNLLRVLSPEKMRLNVNGKQGNTFILDVPIYPGDNEVVAFAIINGLWEYSKVSFERVVVGGILLQKEFSAYGDNKALGHCPNFEKSFNFSIQEENDLLGDSFDPGGIKFEFVPFKNAGRAWSGFETEVDYIYNDTVIEYVDSDLLGDFEDNAKQLLSYKLHVGEKELYMPDIDEIQVLGSGHLVVTLKHIDINNAVFPWSFESIDAIVETSNYTMVTVADGTDYSLMPNQIIVFPEDLDEYVRFCLDGSILRFNKLRTYQKRSFDEEASIDSTFFTTEGLGIEYENQTLVGITGALEQQGPLYSHTGFMGPATMTAVFRGPSGRSIGITKTKMVTWVRQPLAPSVEIKYDWKAYYKTYYNMPNCSCTEFPEGYSEVAAGDLSEKRFQPRCGDHTLRINIDPKYYDVNGNPEIGPMWWPYNNCEAYQFYENVTQGTAAAFDVMPNFLPNGEGKYEHGQHDLRMLGPNDHYGFEDDFCLITVGCPCGLKTYNQHRHSGNIFDGYGFIRSGCDPLMLSTWRNAPWILGWQKNISDTELLPPFGNASRPFLRSFRSMDRIQYPQIDISTVRLEWKWMPVPMYFTDLNLTNTEPDTFINYTSAWGPKPINPFAFMFFNSTVENILLNETLDPVSRFTFDQVFRSYGDKLTIYPEGNGDYRTKANPWYEFLPYPNNTDRTIHWAWREQYKELKRNSDISLGVLMESALDESSNIIGPFKNYGGSIKGKFYCFFIKQPEYKHDRLLREVTIVCNEGTHIIRFIAPIKDEHTGVYTTLAAVKLDNGAEKYFDIYSGLWADPNDPPNYERLANGVSMDELPDSSGGGVYDEIRNQVSPPGGGASVVVWHDSDTKTYSFSNGLVAGVYSANLYTSEGTSATLDDNKIELDGPVVVDPDTGTQVNTVIDTYYNRGLHIELIPSLFTYLPISMVYVNQFNVYVGPDEILNDLVLNALIGVGELMYTDDTLLMSYEFDNKQKTITRVKITCMFGYKQGEPPVLNEAGGYEKRVDTLYHWPAFDIFISADNSDSNWVKIYSEPDIEFSDFNSQTAVKQTRTYNIDVTRDYLILGSTKLSIVFKQEVLDEELYKVIDNKEITYNSVFEISGISLYEAIFVNAEETIETYERKYYVSHGGCGNFPPQGPAEISYFHKPVDDVSIARQMDSRLGLLNINGEVVTGSEVAFKSMNKCRGRIALPVEKEFTRLSPPISRMEAKQFEWFNDLYNEGASYFSAKNEIPAPLKDIFRSKGLYLGIGGNCEFENTLFMRLASLNTPDRYSAPGHSFLPVSYNPTMMIACWLEDRPFMYVYTAVTADSVPSADTMINDLKEKGLLPDEEYQGLLIRDYVTDQEHILGFGTWVTEAGGPMSERGYEQTGSHIIYEGRRGDMAYWVSEYSKVYDRETRYEVFSTDLTDLILPSAPYAMLHFPTSSEGWASDFNRNWYNYLVYGGMWTGTDPSNGGWLLWNL